MRGKNLDVLTAVFRDGNGRVHIELEGDGVSALKKLPDWLDKIAAAAGRQLCELESEAGRRHASLLEAEPLAVRIGVASMRRNGENVSGDKGAYFKTDSGLLYVRKMADIYILYKSEIRFLFVARCCFGLRL